MFLSKKKLNKTDRDSRDLDEAAEDVENLVEERLERVTVGLLAEVDKRGSSVALDAGVRGARRDNGEKSRDNLGREWVSEC